MTTLEMTNDELLAGLEAPKAPEVPTELTTEQTKAYQGALGAFENGRNFILSGAAGSGKTLTTTHIVSSLIGMGYKVAVGAPTGKAADVLNKKQTHFLAKTLHSLLTHSPMDAMDALIRRLDTLEMKGELTSEEKMEEADLLEELDELNNYSKGTLKFMSVSNDDFHDLYDGLVIDESSMVGADFRKEFIDHIQCPKIWVGDYAQLPPINEAPAVNLMRPDVKLTEIHRQKAGSGILDVASVFRDGKASLPPLSFLNKFEDVVGIASSNQKVIAGYETTHQFIVWTNNERHKLNAMIRSVKGFASPYTDWQHLPGVGETIMIDENVQTMRLMKGQLVTVVRIEEFDGYFNPYLAKIRVKDERGNERVVDFCLTDLAGAKELHQTDDERKRWVAQKRGVKVMLSHTITAHKSQGSSYPNVFVMCSMPQTKPDFAKWMYTAITRASEHLVVADYRLR